MESPCLSIGDSGISGHGRGGVGRVRVRGGLALSRSRCTLPCWLHYLELCHMMGPEVTGVMVDNIFLANPLTILSSVSPASRTLPPALGTLHLD